MFPSPSGGGAASPYKAKKRRFPKIGVNVRRPKAVTRQVGGGAAAPGPYSSPRARSYPIKGEVGNIRTTGGGLKKLPRNERYAVKGTSPTSEPAGQSEAKSRQYTTAKRRTASKFRRQRRKSARGF